MHRPNEPIRNVRLRDGNVRWMFPTLSDHLEAATVARILEEADDTMHHAGQLLGAEPDAQLYDIPLNRFYYQRLGPGPEPPAAVLMAEGGHEPITTTIACLPVGPDQPDKAGPILRPGPPWRVDAWITIACDSQPRVCSGHDVRNRVSGPVDTPVATAREIHAAATWIFEHAQTDTLTSLRELDPLRGHDPLPARLD